jgi:hypothetical protein
LNKGEELKMKLKIPRLGLLLALLACSAARAAAQPAGQGAAPFLRIVSPENLSSLYGAELVEFRGRVGPGCQAIAVSYFDAAGRLVEEYRLKKYLPGSPEFLYRAGKELGNLAMGSNRYLFVARFEGGREASEESVIYIHEHQGEKAKPVIYLYPTAEARIEVRVRPLGGVSKSVPDYGEGWTVTARPDGALTDAEGRSWPYLFWESPAAGPPAPLAEGFTVAREDLDFFFRQKLRLLGLRGKEIEDFLGYWLPLMADKPWYAIRFAPRAEIDLEAPLEVSPLPDSVIRVLVDWRGGDAPFPLPAQRLEPAERRGFAVVEWGGMRYR